MRGNATKWIVAAALMTYPAITLGQQQPAAEAAGQQQQQQQQPAQQEQQQQQQQQQPGQQAQAGIAQEQGQTPLSRVQSFIGDDTVSVLHVDLGRADLARVQEFFQGVVADAEIPQAQKQQISAQIAAMMATAQPWAKNIQQAGAEHLFLVTSLQGDRPAMAVIVPTDAGDNQDKIRQLLLPPQFQQQQQQQQPGQPGQPGQEQAAGEPPAGAAQDVLGQPQAKVIRDAVVATTADLIAQFEQPRQADVQAFQNAFQATNDASVQLLVRPTEQLQQVMMQQGAGQFPFDPAGDVDFSKKAKWMAIGIDYPNQQQVLQVVINATSPEAAQDLAGGINRQIAKAQQQGQAEGAPQLAAGVEALKPEIMGDRVTISLNKDEAARLLRQSLMVAPQLMPPAGQQQQKPGQQPAEPGYQQQQQPGQQGAQPGQPGQPAQPGQPGAQPRQPGQPLEIPEPAPVRPVQPPQ